MFGVVPEVSLASVLAVLGGIVGVWSAVMVYRSRDLRSGDNRSDLVLPFLAMTLLFSVVAFCYPILERTLPTAGIASVPLLTQVVLSVPWTVFALRYAGRGSVVTRGRVIVFALITGGMVTTFLLEVIGVIPTDEMSAVNFVNSLLVLVVLAIVLTTSGIVVRATYRHGTRSIASGGVVVLPIVLLVLSSQMVSLLDVLTVELLVGLSLFAVALFFPLALLRYEVLTTRPGTGIIGERAVIDTMNEGFVVVDRSGEIIRTNQQAQDLFGADIETNRFETVFDCDPTDLRERETVEQWTERGHRRFDPRVSTLTDDSGHELGHTVTLLDVTDREIRRQRIQVLNRILRHNIRNELSAIEARAELALDDDQPSDDHIETVLDIADDLNELSAEARQIETLMADTSGPSTGFALDTFVESVVENVLEEWPEVTVSIDIPEKQSTLDRSLLRYALTNVVENAAEHNDAATPRIEVRGDEMETGMRIDVADNGPGIPDAEREVIEAGAEQPLAHASSLGLWGTNWAVQALGGSLSFAESDFGGTTMRIELPAEPNTP